MRAQEPSPQVNVAQQQHAIRSLVAYASHASAFVIVAPTVKHREECSTCDISTYRTRLWTRVEQLCFMLKNGTHRMWIATSTAADGIYSVDKKKDWLEDNVYVFEGNATDDRDKLHLKLPMLGLYAGLYATSKSESFSPGRSYGSLTMSNLASYALSSRGASRLAT